MATGDRSLRRQASSVRAFERSSVRAFERQASSVKRQASSVKRQASSVKRSSVMAALDAPARRGTGRWSLPTAARRPSNGRGRPGSPCAVVLQAPRTLRGGRVATAVLGSMCVTALHAAAGRAGARQARLESPGGAPPCWPAGQGYFCGSGGAAPANQARPPTRVAAPPAAVLLSNRLRFWPLSSTLTLAHA